MSAPSPGPLALVGSGEFLPAMEPVDRELLAGRSPRVVFLPTAAAPEGDAVLARWVKLGTEHYRRLGVEAVPVLARDPEDAADPRLVEKVAGAGLVYLSGGNPGYLARTLRDTPMWEAILAAWRSGAALAGCSAGAMALTASAPDVRGGELVAEVGLGPIGHLAVIPHFDRFTSWRPGLVDETLARLPPGVRLLGLDEDTALVGGPERWTVRGRQRVWLIGSSRDRRPFEAGREVVLPAGR